MTAQQLFDYLSELQNDGNNLSKISVNYRYDYDSDVEQCNYVLEDLFDAKNNSILTSIVITTKLN